MADITHIFGGAFEPPPEHHAEPPEAQLIKAIISSGLEPDLDSVYLDGEVHRFRTGGHKSKTGWYIAFADGVPAGRFGCWRQGVEQTWRAETDAELSAGDMMALRARMDEAKRKRDAEREKQQEITADVVMQIWSQAQAADDSHPYLMRKGVQAHGARVTGDGRLVVPLYDASGELSSVQYIAHDGDKQYHARGKTGGCFWMLGDTGKMGVLYMAEGFATAATVVEHTGQPCVVAYSASNLPPVAEVMRERWPDRRIVIVADNDAGGIGRAKAEQACAKTGATWVMPPTVGMDANDWVQSGGTLADFLGAEPEPWLERVTADWLTQPAPLKWLVKGWMPEQCLGMLHGPSGAGKSFVLLDIMMHIVTGLQWQGKRTKQGCVVYLAGEGNYGMRSRVAAWMQQQGLSGDIDLFVSRSGCDLNTPDGYAHAMRYLQEVARHHTILAVCVDTLHRFLHGDENSAQDAKTMIDACDSIKRELSTSVWLVHHTGLADNAQDRARGSSAWRGALDVEIGLRPPSESAPGVIIQHKMKDAEQAMPIEFRLRKVPIAGWVDEAGDQVNGAVVEWLGEHEARTKDTPVHRAVRSYYEAWSKRSKELDSAGRPVLSASVWRAHLISEGASERTARNKTSPGGSGSSLFLAVLIGAGKVEAGMVADQWTFIGDDLAGEISRDVISK